MLTPDDVRYSAFMDDLGTDWVAFNTQGDVLCRAHDEATVRRAVPRAAAYMTSGRFVPAQDPDSDRPPQVVDLSPEPAAPVNGSAFDHDGDGKVGGNRPRKRKKT